LVYEGKCSILILEQSKDEDLRRNFKMTKVKFKKCKKILATLGVTGAMLMGFTSHAAEEEVQEIETTLTTEESIDTAEVSSDTDTTDDVVEVEADDDVEAEVVEETTDDANIIDLGENGETIDTIEGADSLINIGDWFATEDQTPVVDETMVNLIFAVPSNTVFTKDGKTMSANDLDSELLLSEGVITLSQANSLEYKNRIESDVIVTINNGNVEVSFNGSTVQGTVTDDLGNKVSFDGTTVSVTNSDKMEDILPEEEEDETKNEVPETSVADYTVVYYKDALVASNWLGQYTVSAISGSDIDYSTIDVDLYKPTDYRTGEIQYEVSSTIVTDDDRDIVYVLYVPVIKETIIETEVVEIPTEVEKVVEVEKEVPVEVPVEKEVVVEVEKEVIKEVPVEKEVLVEVPVETIKEVEVPVYIEKEVPVETTVVVEKEVPVETVNTVYVEKEVPTPVYVTVEDTDTSINDLPESSVTIEEAPFVETDESSNETFEANVPQTGDSGIVVIFMLITLLSGLAAIATARKNKAA
jgi:hypothetical protein